MNVERSWQNKKMNNSCEYYIQRIDETGEGLKPCTNNAKYLLIYYNELEDAVKQFFYCEDCYAELCIKNMDYFNSPKSKVIDLETLIPTHHKDKSAEWLKFANLPEEHKSRLVQ